MVSNVKDAKHVAALPSVFAQTVLIVALLKAGKSVKRKVPEKLSFEYFDLQSITWKDFEERRFISRGIDHRKRCKFFF